MTGPDSRNRTIGLAIASVVFAFDQLSKWFVVGPLDLPARGEIEVLPIFKLLWVNNSGVSLGLLTARTALEGWGLAALTAAIATGVAIWLWRERSRPDVVALGMILGGAAGNIVDRVTTGIAAARYDLPGHVIDFANLHFGSFSPFLVFNVADAAITIGVLLLLFRALLARDKPKAVIDA